MIRDPVAGQPSPVYGSPPDWLTIPHDINALGAGLWPRTATRDTDGVLRVGGACLTDIATEFDTPAYLFDEAEFRARCARFRSTFPDFDIYYAGKAFMSKASARLVAQEGLGLDVCTLGELAVARAVDFPAHRMVLHGNNKSERELRAALEYGVARIVVDSFDEIDLLTRLVRELGGCQRVLLRATVGVRSDTHEHNATAHEDQKFGFSVSGGAAAEGIRRILSAGVLELVGLHVHVGSQILDISAFEAATRRSVALHATVLAEHGVELPELSLGGGLGIAYNQAERAATAGQLAEILRGAAVSECGNLGLGVPRLAIEPGRAIAGPAGCTLYRVGTVKHVHGYRTYLSVDGGMSDNIRPALFGTNYSVTVANRSSSAEPMLARVVGKHCDAGDVVVRDAFLPADIRPGDLLAIPGTGAYCRSLSNNFNHMPRPPVIAVAEGRSRVIIRRETETDLLTLDVG